MLRGQAVTSLNEMTHSYLLGHGSDVRVLGCLRLAPLVGRRGVLQGQLLGVFP